MIDEEEENNEDEDDNDDDDDDDDSDKNDDGSELGSELDDEEDNIVTDNKIHCIYDTKKRVKRKWKLVLRSGVLHMEGKDYIFDTIQAEMNWNEEK